MPARKSPPWTPQEVAILCDLYPCFGVNRTAEALTDRTWAAVEQKAFKLGLRSPVVARAPTPKLTGDDLERAIRLREDKGWSFARIGATFGVAEISASNAVLIALCPRKGHTPAERDKHGRLTDQGRERLRLALRKGLKGVEIQLRLGVSAACVAEQRRRYRIDLKERGKAPLPPPGAGQSYSGIKLTRAQKQTADALFMDGFGTAAISEKTGISKTSCTRIRNRLIKRLKKRGECLPGCDLDGVRHVQKASSRFVTNEQKTVFNDLLLKGTPVVAAAKSTALGTSTAYRLRDALDQKLASEGRTLPQTKRNGQIPAIRHEKGWPPKGPKEFYRFRAMIAEHGFDRAKALFIGQADQRRFERQQQMMTERKRPMTFEEQLAAVRSGRATITAAFPQHHLQPKLQPEARPPA